MTEQPRPFVTAEQLIQWSDPADYENILPLALTSRIVLLIMEVERLHAELTTLQARWEQQPLLLDGPGASFLPTDSIAGRHHQPWGQYRQARGAVPWDGEPAEETIRRVRDADRPDEPPLPDDAKGVIR